jgi:hypothetical protein
LGAVIGIVAIFTMGAALPYPFSAVGPTTPVPLRVELVQEIAVRQRPRCLVLIGNSRAAFGVNATKLSTPGCGAANLGFAGFDTLVMHDLALAEAGAGGMRSLVVFATDELLMRDGIVLPRPPAPIDFGLILREPVAGLIRIGFVRRGWISHYRFQVLFDVIDGGLLPDHVFRWNADLGRWIWPANETLRMDTREDRAGLLQRVSEEYYGGARAEAGSAANLAAFIAPIRRFADKTTIIFPPQHSEFARAADKLRPGLQRKLIQRLATAATEVGIRFIDCSNNVDCGLSDDLFADPVHLNAAGADRFTEFLKAQDLY